MAAVGETDVVRASWLRGEAGRGQGPGLRGEAGRGPAGAACVLVGARSTAVCAAPPVGSARQRRRAERCAPSVGMAEEQPPPPPGAAGREERAVPAAAADPARPCAGRQVEEEEEAPPRREAQVPLRRYPAELCSRAPCLFPDLLEQAVDREKCRSIRRQYRQLIHSVQQNREDIVNTASDSLTEALEEANVLFDGVSRTREAALDAQFLVLASDLGKEKAKHLNSDMSAFNHVAFCDVLLVFMGLSWIKEEGEELGDCDESEALFFWGTVQKEAKSWILRAETFHFILGSFRAERARRPRLENPRRARRMEGNGDMPTKLRKLDPNANQETTEKEVERILGLLQTYFEKYPDTPVSYFEFVIDPNSFSRTVENIFYVSFIIRDGFARIRLDHDRLPILEPTHVNQVDEENDSYSYGRKQGVISLSLQDWKNIVSTFEISEAMIKNSF